jgi:hypothetical protein
MKGKIELGEKEILSASLKYITRIGKLKEAIRSYLLDEYKIESSRIDLSNPKEGLHAVIEIDLGSLESLSKLASSGELTRKTEIRSTSSKGNNAGFTRSNVGFSDTLSDIINAYRKGKRKMVSFDEVLEKLQTKLPALDRKRAYIYISDKRLQERLKFEFTGNKGAKQIVL